MQKLILPLAILVLVVSCKLKEKPEFVRVDKIVVDRADFKTIALRADAVFINHNHLGGLLKTDDIEVFVDDHVVAKVSYEEFQVPAQDEFVVPLSVNFDTAKLVDNKNTNLLGSLINQFLNKKVVVRFKGELQYKVVGFSSTYPIDHTQEILIK